MRISDWSSDVCSSDLARCRRTQRPGHRRTADGIRPLGNRADRRLVWRYGAFGGRPHALSQRRHARPHRKPQARHGARRSRRPEDGRLAGPHAGPAHCREDLAAALALTRTPFPAMPLTRKDALLVGDILRHAAATEIMPRFQRLAGLQVREKASAFDVVTDADEAAEEVIAATLQRAFPSARIIGEEAAAKDPKLLDSIATADLAFIIDPIDGTKNFTAGLPLFGVMAAATIRGEEIGRAHV